MSEYGQFPYGLTEVVVVRGALQAALPASQRVMFGDNLISGKLRGDQKTQALVSIADGGKFEVEAGGISLQAYEVITGRAATEAGVSPDRTTTLIAQSGDRMPYFEIYGLSAGDNDDGVYIHIRKAKVMEAPGGEFKLDEFYITKCSGECVDPGDGDGYWQIISQETYQAIAGGVLP